MKKPAAKKTSEKRTGDPRLPKRVAAEQPKPGIKASVIAVTEKLTFRHAMIYVKDVERRLRFHRDLLRFKLIEDFRYEGTSVYARMRAPDGDGTIALHQAGPEDSVSRDGVREPHFLMLERSEGPRVYKHAYLGRKSQFPPALLCRPF